ncbi:MAG: colanic acid biosynthesis glycosyl transferase WcaI [Alphaproteobacteria bacterium]|nr:colanic acid biosynthesis glycosyl transferase WcaI [Alphaproteobacteria bacterium]
MRPRGMKRIIFLNRYFFPDHSATSQILSDLAFHLASRGHDVHVITSQQRYDDARARLPATATVAGVEIHRLATTRFGRAALVGRGFDYLSFYASMWRCVLDLAEPGDILVAKTDPPLLCLVAMQAARRRSLHFVNWLQDLYPEVAMQLGIPFFNGPIGHGLCRLRDRALRAADANVAVGAHMAENIRLRGIAPERVHVIPNWCDDEEICPLPAAENPLRREWGLEDRFVVGYSGNLGRGHDINAVLAAADRLRHHPRMLFLCIGGGHKFDELARCAAERRLDHVFRFIPYLERERLKFSLTVPDVHWISLKPELEGLILPSKLYGIAAAGRPIIAITAKDGEIARLVRQHACGFVIEPDNADSLAEVLTQLSADPDGVAAMGARARHMLDLHFTRRQGFERWRGLLESIG